MKIIVDLRGKEGLRIQLLDYSVLSSSRLGSKNKFQIGKVLPKAKDLSIGE